MSKEGKKIEFHDIREYTDKPATSKVSEQAPQEDTKEAAVTEHNKKVREEIRLREARKEGKIVKEIKEKNEDWKKDIEANYANKTITNIMDRAKSEGVSLYATIDEKLHQTISEFFKLQNKHTGESEEAKKAQSENTIQLLRTEAARHVFREYTKFFNTTEEEKETRKKIVKIDEKTNGTRQHVFDEAMEKNIETLEKELAQIIDATLTADYVHRTLTADMHGDSQIGMMQLPIETITIEKLPNKKRKISDWFREKFGGKS
ncbi:MAG: hypothetical protein KBD29_02745 [Candidatus Magasanikbacteria bacterium]|nr:hypothetical protein [Candidatus Magasanikbacteria bacterium]